jgi:uncharacterized protein (DUF885 family)
MPSEFVPIAESVIDSILTHNPTTAMMAGDHRVDGALPDFSRDGVTRRVEMLQDASDTLAQLDPDALNRAELVDHAILSAHVDRALFELTEVREHEWNPLSHNPGALLNALIDRPTGPIEERLARLGERLAAIPDAMATARATLYGCPQIHVETAVGQFAGAAALVGSEVPRMLDEVPSMRAEIEPAAAAAVAALTSMSGWLQAVVNRDGRDPRLGRRLWEARLWHTLDTEMSARQVLDGAHERLAVITDQLREHASAYVGGLENDETVRRAFAAAAQRRPDDATIVEQARRRLAETTAFVADHALVSLVDDRCDVREMPQYARGVAIAYCLPPGALETADVPTFFCIAPTPETWSAERVESFYREYNDDSVANLTVHEAMPGHFLQLAHARRYRGSTRTRALGFSGPFVEGWACYAEQIMADAGFGGVEVRLQQLKMQLRLTLNAILDQLVHCDDLSEVDGMALMLDRGFQEDGEAAGKWRRALLSSTQLSTYFVGYTEVSAIGRARPAGVTALDWHDQMLAYSSPPPRHLRTLLDIPNEA